jgi:predicted DNA-binding protein (UPF0251 family)
MKPRRVGMEPIHFLFGPLGQGEIDPKILQLTVDEFECLRLLDIEHLTQEEASKQMNIARTTIQRIYETARNKIARMLVEGAYLEIRGGHYVLRDDRNIESEGTPPDR